MSHDPHAVRGRFPILEHKVHLVSHSLGAMPAKAQEYVGEYLRLWNEEGVVSWRTWLPYVDETGDVLADVLGVNRGTVAMGPNVSFWQSVVASALDFSGPRKKVVYSSLNFSTLHYVWMEQRRRGAEVCVVESEDGVHLPMEAMLEAIDETTAIVPISHVSFRSSARYDVAAIVARAREVGALVLLDCYQSAGAMPLNLGALGVDMACGGSVKWLCGGPGAAYLYVREDLRSSLRPMMTGWFSDKAPFSFHMGSVEYADSPWRFVGGTNAIPALYAARAGYETALDVGLDAIRGHSIKLTELLMGLCDEAGLQVNTPRDPAQRGGTVCFDFPGSAEVKEALIGRNFLVDHRPNCGIRASPHYYTTEDEVRSLVAAVVELRQGR